MSNTPTNGCVLNFVHPRDSRKFEAEVGPQTTGQQALDGLVQSSFLEAATPQAPYVLQLQRTGANLPLGTALMAQGAREGDTVLIHLASMGA